MTIYVVMGNDYPAAVFSTAERAENFCRKKREERGPSSFYEPRINWRMYNFELDRDEEQL